MKKFHVDVEFVKRLLFSMLIMSAIILLIDLYVPIKIWLSGDKIKFGEVMAYIRYLPYFPFILLISIAIGFYPIKSKQENSNKL